MIGKLHGVDQTENEKVSIARFNELERILIKFKIVLDGAVDSRQYSINTMARSRNIERQLANTAAALP